MESDSKLGIPQAWLLAACVVLASKAAAARLPAITADTSVGKGPLSETNVAEHFGVAIDDVLSGVALMQEKCGRACQGPIVTAYNLVEIYLEALLAGQLDRQVSQQYARHHGHTS